MIDHKNRRQTNWSVQAGGVYELSANAKVVQGVPTMEETREQFEARSDQQFFYQTGMRLRQHFIIELPSGLNMTLEFPYPIGDISGETRYSGLPQQLRDVTWKNVCQGALSRLRSKSTGN